MGDGDCATPSPEEGRVENLLFRFVSVPPLAQQPAVPKTSIKEQFPSISGSQEEESGEPCITSSLPSSSLARQQVVAQEHPSCPFVEPGKGGSTPVPASKSSHAGLSQASSRVPVFPSTRGGIR